MSPGSAFGRAREAKGWRDGRKRSRRSCRRCAGGSRRTNPQVSNGPRERVRLPGKGKLWRGAPRTRAGNGGSAGRKFRRVVQSARRRGPRRTAGSKRSRASREPAGTVERGKNPEDGTDEGLAILVPHMRPRGSVCRRRGTRRSCVRGQETSREADPRVPRGVTPEGRRFEGRIPRGVSRRNEPAGGGVAHKALKRA
jgi:hypothetical protein